MRWRVRIDRAVVTTDGRGVETRTWAPLTPNLIAAQRMTQRPTEGWKASGTAAELESTWRIHWSPLVSNLSPEDRLIYDGRPMEILGVTELGRREGLEIVTKSAAPGTS